MRRQRAAVLVMVLWGLVILSLLAGGMSMTIREDLTLGNISRDRMIAHWCARAGVERAITAIAEDLAVVDTEADLWSKNELVFKDVKVGDGAFSMMQERWEEAPIEWYGASDESAKLNVSVATREQLMKLPHMTAPIVGAILDWRDKDENPEPDGVERGYYTGLSHPYVIRNGPFRTIRELLLVRGVTRELFYGEDTNVNGRLDSNENDGDASDPPDNQDGRLDRGWYAYLTPYSFEKNVTGMGKDRLNLKNADAATLTSRLHLEDWAAQSIVNRRGQSEFKHIVDLLDVTLDPTVTRGSTSNDTQSRSESEKNQPVTKSILKSIIDELTLSDEKVIPGRVNINTAPLAVLATLMDKEIAEAVVRAREGGSIYESIADLLDLQNMTKEKFANLESSVTVRSNVFRILSRGEAASGLASETIECIVDRSQDSPRVLYWLESSP